jgi:hypothetical protein
MSQLQSNPSVYLNPATRQWSKADWGPIKHESPVIWALRMVRPIPKSPIDFMSFQHGVHSWGLLSTQLLITDLIIRPLSLSLSLSPLSFWLFLAFSKYYSLNQIWCIAGKVPINTCNKKINIMKKQHINN